ADSWLKVKPSTIRNCWEKTKIINFKFSNNANYDDPDELPDASDVVPLGENTVNPINDIIPQLPGNTTDIDQLELDTDEESLIICKPSFVEMDITEEVEETKEISPAEIEEDVVE
ncbi:MAG: hypothetical protein EXX96DRAFT_640712, partial [Benjaminiella poitrasii]